MYAAFFCIVLLNGTGCAKSADVEAIGARVTVLETKVAALVVDITAVKAAALDAAEKATDAAAAAKGAAEIAEEINNKVDKMIKQNCRGDC
jgi:hypothetical protein